MKICRQKIGLAILCVISCSAIHAMKTTEQIFKIDDSLIDKAFQEVNDDETIIKQALEQSSTKLKKTIAPRTNNVKHAHIQNVARAYFFELTALCKGVWVTECSNESFSPLSQKEIKDHVFYNAWLETQQTSVNKYFSEFKKKGQFVNFNKEDVVEDFSINYCVPGVITALETKLKHAPYRLACELGNMTKISQFCKGTFAKATVQLCNKSLIRLSPTLHIPTYNFSAVQPIKLRYTNPQTKRPAEIENSLIDFTESYQFISGEKYIPQENSKNPHFDAERDYVVPMCVKLFTKKHPKVIALKELSALKTCIEKSENKEFSDHMKPAIEKIDQALQDIKNKN